MPIPILQYGVKVRDPTTQQFSDLAALRGGQGPQGTTGPGVPAGGTDGDVLVKNGATDYDARWTNTPKLMGNLATVEYSNTASQLYNHGDYLVYNGQLYKVTATTISQGVTLDPTPGSGNIEAASVFTNKLINSDAITTTHQINAVSSIKIGPVFFFNVDIKLTSNISMWVDFATLTGLKLESSQYVVGRLGDTMTTFYVGKGGNIQATMAGPSGKEIRISGSILI